MDGFENSGIAVRQKIDGGQMMSMPTDERDNFLEGMYENMKHHCKGIKFVLTIDSGVLWRVDQQSMNTNFGIKLPNGKRILLGK